MSEQFVRPDSFYMPVEFAAKSDLDKTTDFFHALGYADRDRIFSRRFHDKKQDGKLPDKMECELGQYASFRESMMHYNQEGYGLFFVVNGNGQTDAEVIRAKKVRAQFVEMDEYSFEDQIRKIEAFPLEPSIIVKTRKSLHTYWLIKDGDINAFRDIQKRLAFYFDGDAANINESRTMRIPYFYHNKMDPVLVEIVHFRPEYVYTQDELANVLPEVEDKRSAASKKICRNERYELPEVIEIGQREHELFLYACSLQAKGYPDQEISALVHDANRTRCTIPLSDTEIDNAVLRSLKNYAKGNALKRFHKFSAKGIPYDINDEAILQHIIATEHLMIIERQLYIYDHGVYILDDDGIRTRAKIKALMFPEVIKNGRIKQAYDLILAEPSIQKSMDDVNNYPKSWINFRNGMLDVKNMVLLPHDPKYYAINQLPHNYDPDHQIPEGSIVAKFMQIKFPDPDDRKMYLQYCGYCMTPETNRQKFLVLYGSGNTGKSTLIRLLSSAIGSKNISNLSLQDVGERFRTACLQGKLLNACADLPSKKLDQLSAIKLITGEDKVTVEYKGGKPFPIRSYAKLIFSANIIPPAYEDETGAFYRRLLLIEINERGEEIMDLEAELQKDIMSFMRMSIDALHDGLLNGFIESENSKRHTDALRAANDSVWGFLEDDTSPDPDYKLPRTVLYEAYEAYCQENGWQAKTRHNFYDSLQRKGFNAELTIDGIRHVKGLRLKEKQFHASGQGFIPFD